MAISSVSLSVNEPNGLAVSELCQGQEQKGRKGIWEQNLRLSPKKETLALVNDPDKNKEGYQTWILPSYLPNLIRVTPELF